MCCATLLPLLLLSEAAGTWGTATGSETLRATLGAFGAVEGAFDTTVGVGGADACLDRD